MLPRYTADFSARDSLLVLFVLSIRPELACSFPSFLRGRATPSTSYTETLMTAIKDISDSSVLCENLRFILRRLDASTSSTATSAPIVEVELYTKFVQAERAARYPSDAYTTLFHPRLRFEVGSYLEEVFEIWSAFAARAEVNNISGGKLCLLLGWWLWGNGTSRVTSWQELYESWEETSRRVEHLFMAWLRYVKRQFCVCIG
jgi:hypothetical protein